MLGHAKLSFFDLVVEDTHVFILEGQEPTVHCEEYDTRRPDINLCGIVFLFAHHLWCCVTWRTACSLQQLSILEEIPQPKISELDFLAVQQNVLWFEIPMSNPKRV